MQLFDPWFPYQDDDGKELLCNERETREDGCYSAYNQNNFNGFYFKVS